MQNLSKIVHNKLCEILIHDYDDTPKIFLCLKVAMIFFQILRIVGRFHIQKWSCLYMLELLLLFSITFAFNHIVLLIEKKLICQVV